MYIICRPQWPRGLRRTSAAARLPRSWVRIPAGAWMSVCCEWCVLSGRGLCDELITRQEESYRLWCVVVCDLETSRMRRPWPALGRSATKKKEVHNLQMWPQPTLKQTGGTRFGHPCFKMKSFISIPQASHTLLRCKRKYTQQRLFLLKV